LLLRAAERMLLPLLRCHAMPYVAESVATCRHAEARWYSVAAAAMLSFEFFDALPLNI